jgi:2-polyprenyl-3-methyl-5-hydroxy-6-metoxy-1,4-benzoquinol methylase
MDLESAQAVAAEHAPSDYYVDHYRRMERMYLPALFKAVRGHPPTRVLEIGPGWGTTAVWLADRGHDVTVMDLLPVGTFMTQALVDRFGISYVHFDIEDAPGPADGSAGPFDLVIMTQVIPHLAWRPDRALRHVRLLMEPDGELIASALDRKSYPDLEATFGDDWRNVPEWGSTARCEDTVKCMYTRETLRDLLHTVFGQVSIWKPLRSKVLFAKASNHSRGSALGPTS